MADGKTYEEKLAEVGMQSLEDRRARGDAIQTWKILTKYDDVEENTWFERRMDMTDRTTRQSTNDLNLEHKSFKHDYRKFSYSARAVRQWNDLPNNIRSAVNLRSFKAAYDNTWKHVRHLY